MGKLLLIFFIACGTLFAVTGNDLKDVEKVLNEAVEKALAKEPLLHKPSGALKATGDTHWRFGSWIMTEKSETELAFESSFDIRPGGRRVANVTLTKKDGRWSAGPVTVTTYHLRKE